MRNQEAYIVTYQHKVGYKECDGITRDAYVSAENAAAAMILFDDLYGSPVIEIRQVIAITLSDSRELYNRGAN